MSPFSHLVTDKERVEIEVCTTTSSAHFQTLTSDAAETTGVQTIRFIVIKESRESRVSDVTGESV